MLNPEGGERRMEGATHPPAPSTPLTAGEEPPNTHSRGARILGKGWRGVTPRKSGGESIDQLHVEERIGSDTSRVDSGNAPLPDGDTERVQRFPPKCSHQLEPRDESTDAVCSPQGGEATKEAS